MAKFLIDECLTLDLVAVARQAGHSESSHVVWMGKAGWQDWQLKPYILEGDWTFVTRNSVDFRGDPSSPGTKGQYADVSLHAGLICINGPLGFSSEMQCELFAAVLEEVGADELVNEVVEVTLESAGIEILISRYSLPV